MPGKQVSMQEMQDYWFMAFKIYLLLLFTNNLLNRLIVSLLNDYMQASQQDKNICFKILKKAHPDLHSSILSEIQKGYSNESLEQVEELKQIFDKADVHDRRLFVAVVIKLFHPSLYESDNKDISLKLGLNKAIAKQLNMKESNTANLIQLVRTWLKHDIENLRTRADNFYEQNLK